MKRFAESDYEEKGRIYDADICFSYFHPGGEEIDTDAVDIHYANLTPKESDITIGYMASYFSDITLDIWRDQIGEQLKRHYPDMTWCTPALIIYQAW